MQLLPGRTIPLHLGLHGRELGLRPVHLALAGKATPPQVRLQLVLVRLSRGQAAGEVRHLARQRRRLLPRCLRLLAQLQLRVLVLRQRRVGACRVGAEATCNSIAVGQCLAEVGYHG